ncbi:MAG: hypothetical protein ABIT76_13920 [Chthoniobacterales bacterium]
MSDHSITLPKAEQFDSKTTSRLGFSAAVVGIVGLIIAAIYGFRATHDVLLAKQFAFSALFGFLFFFTILAGSLFWVILHHATDAAWSVVVRRQMENLASLMPYLAIFFIPLVLFRTTIWEWINVNPEHDPVFASKTWYFYPVIAGVKIPLFWIRSVFYFAFFTFFARTFRSHSAAQDATGDIKHSLKMRTKSYRALPFFALSITFAGIDWIMALNYKWYSTMWGVYIFAGSALSSMAVLILVITGLRKLGYLQVVNMEHYHIMGKFLLVFSIFWAYIGFSQYMLIWYANIPEETEYFLLRNTESWNTLNITLVVGHFFIPFLMLLFRFVKKIPTVLSWIAIWILCMHFLDIYIIVLPNIHTTGFAPHILDLICPITIGSFLIVAFLYEVGKRSLFPARDPRLVESLKLTN